MPRPKSIPQIAKFRGEYDPQRKLYHYRMQWRVGRRVLRRNKWLPGDAEAWEFMQAESGRSPGGVTWSQILDRWEAVQADRTPNYRACLRAAAKRLVDFIGDDKPERLSRNDFSRFLAHRKGAAANHDRQYLRTLAKWAASSGMIQDVPAWCNIGRASHKPQARVRITPQDLPRLLGLLEPELVPIVLWIALTGCRQGAACGLLRADVQGGAALLREKGGARPAIILDEALRDVLARAQAWRRKTSSSSSHVFVNSRGRAWNPVSLAHRISEAWTGGETLHGLRHLWGTEAGRRFGADVVQAALGHRARASAIPYVHVAGDAAERDRAGRSIRATLLLHFPPGMGPGKAHSGPAQPVADQGGITCPHCGKALSEEDLRRILESAKNLEIDGGRVAERQTQGF